MRRLCTVLGVHPNGFYAWCLNPENKRAKKDKWLLVPIKESWLEAAACTVTARSAMTYANWVNNAVSIVFIAQCDRPVFAPNR